VGFENAGSRGRDPSRRWDPAAAMAAAGPFPKPRAFPTQGRKYTVGSENAFAAREDPPYGGEYFWLPKTYYGVAALAVTQNGYTASDSAIYLKTTE
jgi:hypothetical protein